jgi:hypothetical protein
VWRVGLEGQTMILTTHSTLQNEIPQSLGVPGCKFQARPM